MLGKSPACRHALATYSSSPATAGGGGEIASQLGRQPSTPPLDQPSRAGSASGAPAAAPALAARARPPSATAYPIPSDGDAPARASEPGSLTSPHLARLPPVAGRPIPGDGEALFRSTEPGGRQLARPPSAAAGGPGGPAASTVARPSDPGAGPPTRPGPIAQETRASGTSLPYRQSAPGSLLVNGTPSYGAGLLLLPPVREDGCDSLQPGSSQPGGVHSSAATAEEGVGERALRRGQSGADLLVPSSAAQPAALLELPDASMLQQNRASRAKLMPLAGPGVNNVESRTSLPGQLPVLGQEETGPGYEPKPLPQLPSANGGMHRVGLPYARGGGGGGSLHV